MATYIKGVTDTFPTKPEVSVDYSFLAKGLTALQGRYDSAYNSWKSMYNSLINGKLSSQDNIKFRDEYLKQADALLNQVAGVDLAHGANLQQATNLFNPLVNDQEFVTDMYKTKTQIEQFNKMNQLKYSTDPKLLAQYNPIMEDYLNIGMQKLSETKRGDGSINNANVYMFRPWQNVMEIADKRAKENGLKIERTDPMGQWMVKTINGDQAVDTFRNWFKNTIGNTFDDQFRIEAEVDIEKAVRGKMSQDPNLDRNTVLQGMAKDYSTAYVKEYNEDIAALQAQLNSINSQRSQLQRKYPNPSDKVIQQDQELIKQRQAYQDRLNQMTTAKVDDQTLAAKAVNMFMTNPSSVFVDDVRNRYSNAFAYNWAYATQSIERTPNQIWMHEDSQAHDWAMQKDKQKFDREQNALKFQQDVMMEQLKGTIKGDAQVGAGVGQMQDVGIISPEQMYLMKISDNFKNSTQTYTDHTILAVAAGMKMKGNNFISDLSGVDLKIVSKAIQKKSTNQKLDNTEKQQFQSYLNMMNPTNNVKDVDAMPFSQFQTMLTSAVRVRSKEYPQIGAFAVSKLNDALQQRYDYYNAYLDEDAHLKGIVDKELLAYVRKDAAGRFQIDFEKVNAVSDTDKKDALFSKLIPNYQALQGKSAQQMNVIYLNPADPTKFNYSILSSAINNADEVGVTDPVSGEFIKLDKDELAKFRGKTTSGQTLAEVFDPKGTTYERKIVNGQDYIKVTMPMLLQGSGKTSGTPTGELLSILENSDISKQTQNKLEFLIPLHKAEQLAGSDPIIMNPFSGEPIVPANNFRRLVTDLAGRSLLASEGSWVTKGGLFGASGQSVLPEYLRTSVKGGTLYSANDNLMLEVITDEGKRITTNISNEMGNMVRYSDLVKNPGAYDPMVKDFIENQIYKFGMNSMAYSHNMIETNKAVSNSSNKNYWQNNP